MSLVVPLVGGIDVAGQADCAHRSRPKRPRACLLAAEAVTGVSKRRQKPAAGHRFVRPVGAIGGIARLPSLSSAPLTACVIVCPPEDMKQVDIEWLRVLISYAGSRRERSTGAVKAIPRSKPRYHVT